MKSKIRRLAALALLAFVPGSLAQESVDVPQLLQQNVHAFKLTIDSLETLTADMRDHTRSSMRELKAMQQRLAMMPRGSRRFNLLHKEYEEKLSEYWARKYDMLRNMEDLRQRTLTTVDRVLDQLQVTDTGADQTAIQDVLEEVRRTEDRISQTRLEMLQILDALENPGASSVARERLMRKFKLLQSDNLAWYKAHRQRLDRLNQLVRQPNAELPAMQAALHTMRDDLQSRYVWVETEIEYIRLYASYRRQWLDIDARVLEVSGMVERFSEMVQQLNASGELAQAVEDFEHELRASPDTLARFLELPPLNWPGRPATNGKTTPFTKTEIDSLRKALQQELESESPNSARTR